MKKFRATGLGLAVALLMPVSLSAQTVDLEDEQTAISYSVGVNIGSNLVMQGLAENIDLEAFIAGLRDVVADDVKLSDEQMMEALTTFQQQEMERQQAEMQAMQAESEAFLAENGQRDGVTTTESGLQYEILESGDTSGSSPAATDTVLAHYEGSLTDGTVFDSSYERGEPTEFALNQVIAGWTEGLQLMKPGDKWRFFVPFSLAYGPNGSGPIPPFATLIFDVELLEVVSQ